MLTGKFSHVQSSYSVGTAPFDTAFLIDMGGNDTNLSPTSTVELYNARKNTWKYVAEAPSAVTHAHSFYFNGRIYYIGGYNPDYTPIDQNYAYHISSNSWATGVPPPIAVGDYAAVQYQDSLFYLIGGWDGTKDIPTVQIFNASSQTWSTGTDFAGIPL